MCGKVFVATHVLVPSAEGVSFFEVGVDLHHGRRIEGERTPIKVGDFCTFDGDDGFRWRGEFLGLAAPDGHLDGIAGTVDDDEFALCHLK